MIHIKWLRRALFIILSLCTTLGGLFLFYHSFLNGPLNWVKGSLIVLFSILTLDLSMVFWMNIIGFIVFISDGDKHSITHANKKISNEKLLSNSPTALLILIYNEDPKPIFDRLHVMYQSLLKTGEANQFEVFILSDTNDPSIRLQEEQLWFQLCNTYDAQGKIFFHNRLKNTDHKSGHVQEFCSRWGARYEFMIILDSDSIMAGETLVKMVNIMHTHPKMGILQTTSIPINQKSLFGRIMQFSNYLYGYMQTMGAVFWQVSESHYCGHNAIIRTKAFAAHAGLPKLPGKEPLGGKILSHDYVEAALLREAGWDVTITYDLDGSYEGMPTNLIEYAKRDRRWCQGNMQHTWFLFEKKMSFFSRGLFLMGIMAYLVAPIWVFFCALTFVLMNQHASEVVTPVLPIYSQLLLLLILSMLFLPKVLSLTWFLFHPKKLKQFGGGVAVVCSAVFEFIFTILFAPILLFYRTKFVIEILLQRNIGWPVPQRAEHRLSLKEAIQAHWHQTVVGFILFACIAYFVPNLIWWFIPTCLGLMLSIPLSICLSSSALGKFTREWQLFCVPEEINPPEILALLKD